MNPFNQYLDKLIIIINELEFKSYFNIKNKDLLKKIVVEPPKNKTFGDISSNAAMVLSSQIELTTFEIAELISVKLRDLKEINDVSIVKPGFINIKFKKTFWQNYVHSLVFMKKNGFSLI